ncbi:MAG TPA: dynamin family protein [Thermodesulfobacteriota bacterium]|nr:dynamin family protein [Deltaproteobacteria bacterium]HNU70820.1 dynamin family protein [Thermodesulfobacteriota bacterium]
MSLHSVLSPHLKQQYEILRGLLEQAAQLTESCGDKDGAASLRDRLTHLQSAALFVVVGEVKSGKSSFVNALLGEEVCEVAPDPCTAGIQELVYGEMRSKVSLGDQWERLHLPKEVLKEVTIVDTPGTNSIIKRHQTITESYIPQSDLVIFVFPAKNPHTGSSWDLLELIKKDWHRKIVFVLQQADLASQHELATNRERVKQYAHERNVQNPIVFTLSAKREVEDASDSGFAEFRQFLREAVESGEVWQMKVEGGRDTLRRVLSRLLARLQSEEAALSDDRAFYEQLLAKVDGRRERARSLQRLVVDSLCATYDRLSVRLQRNFEEGLGIAAILRRTLPFVRDKDIKTWLRDLQDEFENSAKEEIEAESQRVSRDLSDEMRSMLVEINEAITVRSERPGPSALPLAYDRTELLERLQNRLGRLKIADIIGEQGLQGSDLGSLTLTGGGLAALGAVIALATNLMVFDITGGILAAAGASLVAVTLLWRRSAILTDFAARLEASGRDLRHRLEQEITQMFDKLFLELRHALQEPLASVDQQKARVSPLAARAEKLLQDAQTIV